MGRGSSKAGGGVGPFGGGMTGGDTTTPVRDSRPLTEYIGKGGGSFANEIMTTRDSFESVYGDAV